MQYNSLVLVAVDLQAKLVVLFSSSIWTPL
ncbi:unnamed protein product [Linum tenue]|uniref:Uncharacterized protein n=1 Tax=Linum tenue TaxID=586396 RepID=A0AAV0KXD0_9ROSI|nr:unnamed protein product [Linum tenue]